MLIVLSAQDQQCRGSQHNIIFRIDPVSHLVMWRSTCNFCETKNPLVVVQEISRIWKSSVTGSIFAGSTFECLKVCYIVKYYINKHIWLKFLIFLAFILIIQYRQIIHNTLTTPKFDKNIYLVQICDEIPTQGLLGPTNGFSYPSYREESLLGIYEAFSKAHTIQYALILIYTVILI